MSRTGPWARWVALLDTREAGTSLALTRIFAGFAVLLTVGIVIAHGAVGMLWVDVSEGGYRALGDGPWLVRLLGGPSARLTWSLVGLTMGAGLMLVVGLGARVAALVSMLGIMTLTNLNGHAAGSHDEILTNLLWILVFADTTATASLSCRLRTGTWTSARPVPAWPRYLLIGQLALVYSATGVQKVGASWVPGGDFSALYYILQQPSWQRFDMTWVAHVFPLTQFGTALTWTWEVTALPLLLAVFWFRRTRTRPGRVRAVFNRLDLRTWFVAWGVLMHLATLVLMDVGPFTWVTLAFYWCLFSPDELRARATRRRPG